jgi:hypothetical protein
MYVHVVDFARVDVDIPLSFSRWSGFLSILTLRKHRHSHALLLLRTMPSWDLLRSKPVTLSSSSAVVVFPCAYLNLLLPLWSLTILYSFGLQFALAAGAEVIALTSSKEKIDKVKALGAQHVINYKEVTNWDEEVKKIVSFMLLCLLSLTLIYDSHYCLD